MASLHFDETSNWLDGSLLVICGKRKQFVINLIIIIHDDSCSELFPRHHRLYDHEFGCECHPCRLYETGLPLYTKKNKWACQTGQIGSFSPKKEGKPLVTSGPKRLPTVGLLGFLH
jgi:hypothetical protein